MTQWLKQSTARTVKMGPFLDETDGKTAETGLTIAQADIRLSKNGGAYAQTNNSAGATHDEGGEYGVPLDTTDTAALGWLKVRIHVSGALPVWETFLVVPANVWDAFMGSDYLQVDMLQILGTTLTETSAGYLTAAFKKLFDVAAPVLTAASVNQTGDAYARLGAPAGASVSADIAALRDPAIKRNAALDGFQFFMALASDHVSGATGLTVTATRSLDGAAFAACANAVSELAGGWYKIDLAAADLNGDTVALRFTAATADETGFTIVTTS